MSIQRMVERANRIAMMCGKTTGKKFRSKKRKKFPKDRPDDSKFGYSGKPMSPKKLGR